MWPAYSITTPSLRPLPAPQMCEPVTNWYSILMFGDYYILFVNRFSMFSLRRIHLSRTAQEFMCCHAIDWNLAVSLAIAWQSSIRTASSVTELLVKRPVIANLNAILHFLSCTMSNIDFYVGQNLSQRVEQRSIKVRKYAFPQLRYETKCNEPYT